MFLFVWGWCLPVLCWEGHLFSRAIVLAFLLYPDVGALHVITLYKPYSFVYSESSLLSLPAYSCALFYSLLYESPSCFFSYLSCSLCDIYAVSKDNCQHATLVLKSLLLECWVLYQTEFHCSQCVGSWWPLNHTFVCASLSPPWQECEIWRTHFQHSA